MAIFYFINLLLQNIFLSIAIGRFEIINDNLLIAFDTHQKQSGFTELLQLRYNSNHLSIDTCIFFK